MWLCPYFIRARICWPSYGTVTTETIFHYNLFIIFEFFSSLSSKIVEDIRKRMPCTAQARTNTHTQSLLLSIRISVTTTEQHFMCAASYELFAFRFELLLNLNFSNASRDWSCLVALIELKCILTIFCVFFSFRFQPIYMSYDFSTNEKTNAAKIVSFFMVRFLVLAW